MLPLGQGSLVQLRLERRRSLSLADGRSKRDRPAQQQWGRPAPEQPHQRDGREGIARTDRIDEVGDRLSTGSVAGAVAIHPQRTVLPPGDDRAGPLSNPLISIENISVA